MYGQLIRRPATITAAVALAAVLTVMMFTPWLSRDADTPPDGRPASVDLEAQVRDFTRDIARHRVYREPSAAQRRAVAEGVGLLLDGEREEAARRLAEVDYAVRTVDDRVSGRSYTEVADALTGSRGSAARGWGRIYLDREAEPAWSVQVPHPVADLDTELLGVGVLRGTPGGVMVLAGAHRDAGEGNAADVAHRRDTVFHEVVKEAVERGLPGVQLHGFANDSVPGYDALISSGRGDHGEDAGAALAGDLERDGVAVCRAWERACRLEGRTNQQGRFAADREVPFLHVEFNRDLRSGEKPRSRAVMALGEAAERWR